MGRMPQLAVAALMLLAPVHAQAQIVNVLPKIVQRGEDGLGGEISGSVMWRRGNSRYVDTQGTAAAAHKSGPHTVYVLASGRYNTASGDLIISQTFEHVRYRRSLRDWVAAETYAQHEFDKFRRLLLRTLLGAGLRLTLQVAQGIEAAVGTSYMAEYEIVIDEKIPDTVTHRSSNYIQATFQLDDRIRLSSTTFAQPRINRVSDIRVLSENALVVKGNAWLGLKLAAKIAYDSHPPSDVEKVDSSVESSVVVTF